MRLYQQIISALILIAPAYCANAAPVIFGGGRALDSGRKFIDGKPIFGSNKTVRGTVSGLICGILAAAALNVTVSYNFQLGVALSIGAVIGDLGGSFLKRRLGFKPGASLPLLDQLSFVLVALLFAYAVTTVEFIQVLIILLLTPIVHLLTNLLAYLFGFKKVPW